MLEENYRKRKKRADLQKIVLGTIAAAGLISVGLVTPNVLTALDKLGFIPTKRRSDSIREARTKLVKQGFLTWEGNKLRITEKGSKRLRVLELSNYQLPKPKKWDRMWRVLIFDIPEKRRSLREKVRRTLAMTGFVRLQDSVWIFPYPCEDFVTLLKADFKIGKSLLYMIVDSLEYDTPIRTKFNLK